MSTTKTKKPSGLSITRSGGNFTLKWKIADANYENGQKLRYRTKIGSSWSAWTTLTKSTSPKITDKQTSFSHSFSLTNIKEIEFQVCGNRKKYKKGSKTYNPGWSDWASKTWKAKVPSVTSLTYANASANSGTFTWAAPNSNSDAAVFTRIEAQTCYVRNTSAPPSSAWGATMTKGASGSQTVTEDTEHIAAGNLVRWYRVRAVGPAGASAWRAASHAYGAPASASITSASAVTKGSITQITAQWKDSYNKLKPIDTITLQYAIDVPTDANMSAPSSGWNDAIDVKPNGSTDKIVVNVEDTVGTDECLWVRIKSDHDGVASYSGAKLAQTGKLARPTINAVPNTSTGSVSITITEVTSCTVACTAIFYRGEDNPSNDRIVAILGRGQTSTTIVVSDIIGKTTTCFGAFAFVGSYSGLTISNVKMRSDKITDTDIHAVPPAYVTVAEGPREGTVRLGWDWTWTEALRAEVTWAEYEDAWQSTDKPHSFTVDERFATSWIVAGLDVGKRWYFRVRLISDNDDVVTVGPWSDVVSYDLSSVPDRPVLTLSKSVINEGEAVTARWAFSSAEGVTQDFAEICLVTYEDDEPVYGEVIAHVETAQSVEIERDWETGETYLLAVRTTATSGVQSVWSDPVSLFVADPVTIAITYTNLTAIAGTETTYELETLPLLVTVSGASTSGETTVSVVRAEDYHIDRPDERNYDGFEGETIATYSQIGEGMITISIDDLVGSLDDGAKYTLIATVTDLYDQTATERIDFTVNWVHKADIPSVTIVTDATQRVTYITPVAPEGYEVGDTCDIYRLTIDKPELIFSGAEFGSTYVDPYPGFGEACGHRLVTRTANGDYATADGIGWYDSDIEDGDYLEELNMVINVDGNQIELPYNLSFTNKWNKDFKRTTYLGGAVQGDWNPAVTRDMTADSVIVRSDDLDSQIAMHDLAGFAGVAHIRTPDGSSLTANVLINETQSHDTRRIGYTMTIQAVDPEEPAGMTLEEWEASQAEEEDELE